MTDQFHARGGLSTGDEFPTAPPHYLRYFLEWIEIIIGAGEEEVVRSSSE